MCGVVWCKSTDFLANSNTKLLFLPCKTKKLTKSMEAYKSPLIEIVEMLTEGSILAASTGESFNDQENFEGIWS